MRKPNGLSLSTGAFESKVLISKSSKNLQFDDQKIAHWPNWLSERYVHLFLCKRFDLKIFNRPNLSIKMLKNKNLEQLNQIREVDFVVLWSRTFDLRMLVSFGTRRMRKSPKSLKMKWILEIEILSMTNRSDWTRWASLTEAGWCKRKRLKNFVLLLVHFRLVC